WAHDRGREVTYSGLYAHDPLPSAVEDIDLLVVMGGPQDPSTTTDKCPHFNANAEKTLIARAVSTGKAVVDVCLGQVNPRFTHFGRGLEVGHWHNDMTGLTRT